MKAYARIATFALALASATPALADCYDVFGCTNRDRFALNDLLSGPNCDFLYTMRNAIYAEHHYCFRTARGISTFGNQGCVSSNVNQLGMSSLELANAGTILQAEKAKGCPL